MALLALVLPGLGRADVSVISPMDVIVTAYGNSTVNYYAAVTVEITNGTGSGSFVPCLSVSNNGPYNDGAVEFGTAYDETGLMAEGTCGFSGNTPTTQTGEWISLTFDVPQTFPLLMSADA